MNEQLNEWAAARGYRVAAGPATLLAEAIGSVTGRRSSGELHRGFGAGWLRWFDERGLPTDLGSRAVVVVAIPSPARIVSFQLTDRILKARIPPTYGQYASWDNAVASELQALLPQLGELTPLQGPRKALAARLGLVRYGRNNITYAPGLGSYLLLCAVLTGAMERVPTAPAQGLTAMAACGSCTACLEACPTGAIVQERFLIRAERCVTGRNEYPGAWPSWVPASAHNSLIGCMACQEACPYNRGKLKEVDSGIAFDAIETAAMLRAAAAAADPAAAPWPAIGEKLASHGLDEVRPVIARNLAALVARA
jgi:epoxyqueuosine reductase